MSGQDLSLRMLLLLNVVCSVSIVTVNKVLVEVFQFKFVLLLTSLHFAAGYLFLRFASSENGCKLFTRAEAPWQPILRLSLAGAGSIALLNYSLRFNSVGTYQIMKVSILPVTMALTYLQHIATPTRDEVGAALLVIIGTLVCTVSDVSITVFGAFLGVAGVISTGQYQIQQSTIQKEHGLSSTQALYLMSPPQAVFAFIASMLLETNWNKAYVHGVGLLSGKAAADVLDPEVFSVLGRPDADDIWHHNYGVLELLALLATCVFAVGLNYSTIAVIGKTSAVTMQFVNQLKTVLVIIMGLVLFPKDMSFGSLMLLLAGMICVFSGVAWYTRIKSAGVAPVAATK